MQVPMVVIKEDMIFVDGGEKLFQEKLTKKVGWRSLWIGCEDLWKSENAIRKVCAWN